MIKNDIPVLAGSHDSTGNKTRMYLFRPTYKDRPRNGSRAEPGTLDFGFDRQSESLRMRSGAD